MSILFVCALFLEAKPLIQQFNLKKQEDLFGFQIFTQENTFLIVTGTGKINVAVGTSLILAHLKRKQVCVLNVGICGSLEEEVGRIFLIDKISDNETGRDFFPDNLIQTELSQKPLITVSKVLSCNSESKSYLKQNKAQKKVLIDMEGSAFFEAASFFLPVHQIFLLKIVSDNLNQKRLEKTVVTQIMGKNIEIITNFFNQLKNYSFSQPDFFLKNQKIIEEFFKKAHFTKTKQIQIKNYLRDICLNQEISLEDFLMRFEEIWKSQKTSLEKGKIASDFIQNYYQKIFK